MGWAGASAHLAPPALPALAPFWEGRRICTPGLPFTAAPRVFPFPLPHECSLCSVRCPAPSSASTPSSRLSPSLQLQRPLRGMLLRPGAVPAQRARGTLPQLPRQHGRAPLRELQAELLPLGAAGSLPALPLPPRRCAGLCQAPAAKLLLPHPEFGRRDGFGGFFFAQGFPIFPVLCLSPAGVEPQVVPAGSLQPQCDNSGTCVCKANVTGWKCERCKDGYHSLSEGGCR